MRAIFLHPKPPSHWERYFLNVWMHYAHSLVGCKLIKSSQKSSINTIRVRKRCLQNNRLLNSLRFALMRLFTALFSTSALSRTLAFMYIYLCIKNSVNLVIIASTFSSCATLFSSVRMNCIWESLQVAEPSRWLHRLAAIIPFQRSCANLLKYFQKLILKFIIFFTKMTME